MRVATIRGWLRDEIQVRRTHASGLTADTILFTSDSETLNASSTSGVDRYGQPALTNPETVPARVQRAHKRSVTLEGEEFISTTQVATLTSINVGDHVTIGSEDRVVRAIKTAAGLRGGAALIEALL